MMQQMATEQLGERIDSLHLLLGGQARARADQALPL
jgi:hypothetical protein